MTADQATVKNLAYRAASHDAREGRPMTPDRARWWVGELSYKLGIVSDKGMIDVDGETARQFKTEYGRLAKKEW